MGRNERSHEPRAGGMDLGLVLSARGLAHCPFHLLAGLLPPRVWLAGPHAVAAAQFGDLDVRLPGHLEIPELRIVGRAGGDCATPTSTLPSDCGNGQGESIPT
jgi:hypothetical protein